MSPGPELDKLIHTHIFTMSDILPYSTEIAAAWQVGEKFDYRYLWFDKDNVTGNGFNMWECKLQAKDEYVYADTPSHAICLAALAAKGVET